MKFSFKPIVASLFFAALLILSALLLKGKEAGYWVNGSIYMAWVYFYFRKDRSCRSCSAAGPGTD